MKAVTTGVACLFALAATAGAQPAISPGGIVNAASYAAPGMPNGGIAQGSLFVVFGSNLGAASDPSQLSFPLQTQIGGTSVRVVSGSVTRDALMISTMPTQIAAILPSDVPVGTASVTVTAGGQTSAAQTVQVVPAAFGIFSRNQAGSGPAIVQNFVSAAEQPVNALNAAANNGQVVTLWGTGLGAASGNEADGPVPGRTSLPVEVFVGGKQATNVLYAGRSGCCAGIDQITFEVPPDVQGCYVPIYVRVNGVASNFTSMSIGPSGSFCSDPLSFSASELQNLAQGAKTGLIVLSRLALEVSAGGLGSIQTTTDTGTGLFSQYTGTQFLSTQGLGLPSPGSCTVFPFQGSDILPKDPVQGTQLDAGPALTVTGPGGAKQMAQNPNAVGTYSGTLSGGGIGSQASFLDPGAFTIQNGSGGSVGGFTANVTVPAAVTWTNRTLLAASPISRTQPMLVTWTGGDANGLVAVAGASVFGGGSSPSGGATFICLAPASAGQFTIPANILSALPASAASGTTPGGFLLIGAAGQPSKFTAAGLDSGHALALALTGNTVSYR